jgi:hypothetical protein
VINAVIKKYLWTDTAVSRTKTIFREGAAIEYPIFVPDAIAVVDVSFIFPEDIDDEGHCRIGSVVYDIATATANLHVEQDECMVSYDRFELDAIVETDDEDAIRMYLRAKVDSVVNDHVQRGWRISR